MKLSFTPTTLSKESCPNLYQGSVSEMSADVSIGDGSKASQIA
jgi:hypothetical protein